MLFRELYRGWKVWNKTKKRNRFGEHHVSDRSEDQWERKSVPHLRIVSDELWEAAHARMAAARSAMNLYRGRGALSRYLLPGLARCAWCNGGMQVRTRTRSGGDARYYACTSYFHRGDTVCRNAVQMPMEMIDRAVLARLRELVTVDIVDGALVRLRELHDTQAGLDPRAPVEAELASINPKLEHLAEAIATAGAVPTLMHRLQALDARRQALLDRIATMPATRPVPQIDWATVTRDARKAVREWWQELLGEDVPRTRRVLRALLEEPLRFTPIDHGGRRGYRFEGTVTFGEMLAGNIDVLSLASPGRIELPA